MGGLPIVDAVFKRNFPPGLELHTYIPGLELNAWEHVLWWQPVSLPEEHSVITGHGSSAPTIGRLAGNAGAVIASVSNLSQTGRS